MKQEHREIRKQTRLATKERRKNKVVKIYKVKVDQSHLSKNRRQHLHMLFNEAKWFYNAVLSFDDIFKYDTKVKIVPVKLKDGNFEHRQLSHLSAQMRQSIWDRTKTNIVNLNKSKAKGNRVGRLKYKSSIDSIPLKQHSPKGTYFIKSNNRIKLQGMKTPIRVRGLDQLESDPDIANAHLIRKGDDFYFHITVYEDFVPREKTGKVVGIDMGIKTALVTSEREFIEAKIPETTRMKKLQRSFHRRSKKGSKNRYKLRKRINKEYQKVTNRRNDLSNKVISHLKKDYDFIAFQDESIRAWHSGLFGRTVQQSVLGRIKSALKDAETAYMVDKFFPSTKQCPNCGKRHNDITLNDRWFTCECGYSEDRDVKAAIAILNQALKETGREPISLMPVEDNASTSETDHLGLFSLASICPVKQEAHDFSRG